MYWLDGVLDYDLALVELILCFVQDRKYLIARQKVQYLCTAHRHLSHGNEVCTRPVLLNTCNEQSCCHPYTYNVPAGAQQGTEDEHLPEEYVLDGYPF